MDRAEIAIQYFDKQYNCAQAVFTTLATGYNLSEDVCLKIACAFGAGMGRRQLVCGAVTGALMVLGLKYGKGLHDDERKKKDTYAKAIEFFDKFRQQHGSILCCELLNGLDMNNPDDFRKIEELDLFQTRCRNYVRSAVTILEDNFGV